MAVKETAELTSPHKHIKNTTMCGAILAENNLETAERLLYSQDCKERSQSLVEREK